MNTGNFISRRIIASNFAPVTVKLSFSPRLSSSWQGHINLSGLYYTSNCLKWGLLSTVPVLQVVLPPQPPNGPRQRIEQGAANRACEEPGTGPKQQPVERMPELHVRVHVGIGSGKALRSPRKMITTKACRYGITEAINL